MPRRPRRRTYRVARPLKTIKYSNETVVCNITIPAADYTQGPSPTFKAPIVLNPAQISGMRKIKNISIRGVISPNQPGYLVLACIYLPEGLQADNQELNIAAANGNSTSIYEPNQNVIMSGVANINSDQPFYMSNRLARNLNSNDSVLIFARPSFVNFPSAVTVSFTVNYVIAFS